MTSICSCGWFLSQKEWALSYLPNNNTPKLSFRSENGFFFFLIPCLYFLRCWHSVIASLFVVADTPVVYQCLWIVVICLINGMALLSGKCPSAYQSFFASQHPLGLCFPLLLSVHKCRTFFRCLRASCFHHRYLFFWRSQGHGLQDLGKKCLFLLLLWWGYHHFWNSFLQVSADLYLFHGNSSFDVFLALENASHWVLLFWFFQRILHLCLSLSLEVQRSEKQRNSVAWESI